jgi:hypothetical protein
MAERVVESLSGLDSMVSEVRATERCDASNGEAVWTLAWTPKEGYQVIEDTATGRQFRWVPANR